jgi:hypothetical protein
MATPAFLEYGGQRRVLAILPNESDDPNAETMVAQSLGALVTTVRGTVGNVTVCVEADALSLEHIALDFVERRRDRVEFANRVHCRTDISWSPLVSTEASALSMVWGTDADRHMQSQNAMGKTMVL